MTTRAALIIGAAIIIGFVLAALLLRQQDPQIAEQAEQDEPPAAVIVERAPAPIATVPESPVEVTPADDLRSLTHAYPDGTEFALASGTYRQGRIVPRHGQRFVGGPDVVFNGSEVLRPDAFVRDFEGRWWIGGQQQEGVTAGVTVDGRERDQHPEEVFVDGTTRLLHVSSLEDLEPGAWFFDYDADRIYLHDPPDSFEVIETSVHDFAFGGTAVRDVEIVDVVVEKYASPHYYGALGGGEGNYPTYDWTFDGVVARYNHGGGIGIGPGTTVIRSRVHHNGQIGLVGDGVSHVDGYAAPVVVRDTEIDHNLQLGFDWEHEGGGTKFKRVTAGMTFEDNWVHDNRGPGVWWDVYDEALIATGNLVEDNEAIGIYYELSLGPAVIADNVVIGNGQAGIQVSTSGDVEVRDNLLIGNGDGLLALHNESQASSAAVPIGLEDIRFSGNEVWQDAGYHGINVFFDGSDDIYDEVDYRDNVYHLIGDEPIFLFRGEDLTPGEWGEAFVSDEIRRSEGEAAPIGAGDEMRARFDDRHREG